ncbi:hypothetical protein MKEN_01285100 [Mycena kentingensis (nom. inval.)]|nr:hypothetical protein MKEN_01285100 [Mycena kentingensis (nom. inval.)]
MSATKRQRTRDTLQSLLDSPDALASALSSQSPNGIQFRATYATRNNDQEGVDDHESQPDEPSPPKKRKRRKNAAGKQSPKKKPKSQTKEPEKEAEVEKGSKGGENEDEEQPHPEAQERVGILNKQQVSSVQIPQFLELVRGAPSDIRTKAMKEDAGLLFVVCGLSKMGNKDAAGIQRAWRHGIASELNCEKLARDCVAGAVAVELPCEPTEEQLEDWMLRNLASQQEQAAVALGTGLALQMLQTAQVIEYAVGWAALKRQRGRVLLRFFVTLNKDDDDIKLWTREGDDNLLCTNIEASPRLAEPSRAWKQTQHVKAAGANRVSRLYYKAGPQVLLDQRLVLDALISPSAHYATVSQQYLESSAIQQRLESGFKRNLAGVLGIAEALSPELAAYLQSFFWRVPCRAREADL